MTVVDASIVVRLLQNRRGDKGLRERFYQQRYVHAPALIDAEVSSAIRGLLMASKPTIQIDVMRAEEMLDDFADRGGGVTAAAEGVDGCLHDAAASRVVSAEEVRDGGGRHFHAIQSVYLPVGILPSGIVIQT